MVDKKLPFSKDIIENIVQKFPTPFHIYDERAIKINTRELLEAFSWNYGFKEYFAVKATPNSSKITFQHLISNVLKNLLFRMFDINSFSKKATGHRQWTLFFLFLV